MNEIYLTRAEGAEMKLDIKAVEADMAVVKDRQARQQQTLDQILAHVKKSNSWRTLAVVGSLATGETVAVGLYQLIQAFHPHFFGG